VASLRVRSGKVVGVTLESGEERDADAVVIAAGAWSASLGASGEAPLPLTPLRRHLVLLDPPEPPPAATPTVWDIDAEIYFRPESAALLACPCDEQPWPAEPPTTDGAALELLAQKLARLAPPLAGARVKRAWACLRTFAPDRGAVVGRDPRLGGLVWTAGLGGSGMSVGLALGELAAQSLLDDTAPPAAVTVGRLLA
jgi:glycine/D-amino acid oxidase-like deaminating enzyme